MGKKWSFPADRGRKCFWWPNGSLCTQLPEILVGDPPGHFRPKITKKNGKALINFDVLAGSVINMHDTFKNLVKINFSLEKAVAMTSFNAAQYISENNKGKIDKGFCSNLVVLDKQLNIKKIYLHGSLIS